MSKSSLVTGALGFVGSALTRSLISQKRQVTVLVRDGQQSQAVHQFEGQISVITEEELTSLIPVLSIFHCATHYVFDHHELDREAMLSSNIALPVRIADTASKWGTPVSFVNVSTFMQHYNSEAFSPTCLYASTKQAAEDLLKHYDLNSDISLKTVVFPHIYGEGDRRIKLLNLLIRATKETNGLRLGSGNQVMDLVHIDDAVRAMTIADDLESGRWSISSNQLFTIRQLVAIVSDLAKSQLPVIFDASRDREKDAFDLWDTAPPLPGWFPNQSLADWIKTEINIETK